MKRTFSMSIILILALSFFNAAPKEVGKSDVKVAVLKFKTEVIDYGTIVQNSEGHRLFTFTNTGDAPLVITKVKTSCGCTVPNYSKLQYFPVNWRNNINTILPTRCIYQNYNGYV